MKIRNAVTGGLFAILAVLAGFAVSAYAPNASKDQADRKIASGPKSPLTSEERAVALALNTRADELAQEQRAVTAEGALLQTQASTWLDQSCRARGGKRCTLDDNGHSRDTNTWSLVIVEKK